MMAKFLSYGVLIIVCMIIFNAISVWRQSLTPLPDAQATLGVILSKSSGGEELGVIKFWGTEEAMYNCEQWSKLLLNAQLANGETIVEAHCIK